MVALALGFEANYAGTSFCTPDKLDTLRYASDIVTIRADRTEENGLATIAYDDDGVKTAGKEFNIVDRGIFSNYQMALGQAQKIGPVGTIAVKEQHHRAIRPRRAGAALEFQFAHLIPSRLLSTR